MPGFKQNIKLIYSQDYNFILTWPHVLADSNLKKYVMRLKKVQLIHYKKQQNETLAFRMQCTVGSMCFKGGRMSVLDEKRQEKIGKLYVKNV